MRDIYRMQNILTPLTRGMQNEKVYSESAVSHLMVTSAACGKGLIQGYLQYNETKSRQ